MGLAIVVKNTGALGALFGLFSGILWGLGGVLLGTVLGMPPLNLETTKAPLVVACLHDGIAAFWLLSSTLLSDPRKKIRCLDGSSVLMVCFAALLGGPVAMSGYLLGIQFSSVSYAVSITACCPAFGALFAWIFLKQKICKQTFLGMCITIIGAISLSYAPESLHQTHPCFYIGLALSLVTAIMWGLEGVLSTYAMKTMDTAVAVTIRQSFSFFSYLIFVIPCIDGLSLLQKTATSQSGLVIVLAALVAAASYRFWYAAMSLAGVARGMSLNSTYALWSILFSFELLHIELTFQLVLGALFITTGAMLVVSSSPCADKQDLKSS